MTQFRRRPRGGAYATLAAIGVGSDEGALGCWWWIDVGLRAAA